MGQFYSVFSVVKFVYVTAPGWERLLNAVKWRFGNVREFLFKVMQSTLLITDDQMINILTVSVFLSKSLDNVFGQLSSNSIYKSFLVGIIFEL